VKLVVPSASVVEPGLHVSVLASYAVVGVTDTLESTGAVFAMVTALEVIDGPVVVPSFGADVQVTLSPTRNEAPVSVLDVALDTVVPFTAQV
jgi:hypothetical protein